LSPNSGRSNGTRRMISLPSRHPAMVPPITSAGSMTGPRCNGINQNASAMMMVWCSMYHGNTASVQYGNQRNGRSSHTRPQPKIVSNANQV